MSIFRFLPDDSPLFNPPSALHPKQKVAIDGVRLALDMLADAWTRLGAELEAVSLDREAPLTRARLTLVYMHTWVVVDVIHRLRLLLLAMPGLKRSPEVELAIRKFNEVGPLRDGFQHVDERLQDAVTNAWPLWGSVSWIWSPPDTVGVKARVFSIVVGGIRDGEVPMPNPLGKTISFPLGLVTANAFGQSVDLSMQIERVAKVAAYLDSAMRQVPSPQGGMADILLSANIEFTGPLESAPPNPPLQPTSGGSVGVE